MNLLSRRMDVFARVLLVLALILATFSAPARAQDVQPGCEGPVELCQQVLDLQAKLEAAKDAKAKVEAKVEDKVETKVAVEVQKDDEKKEQRMAKVIAFAAAMAVALKILISVLDQWKGYFTSIRGRALLKILLLVLGFAAFITSNIGMGIPWWQALILAGGGPGALLVHDIMEVIPALTGKKQQKEDEWVAKKVDEAIVASMRPPPAA